MTHMTKTNTSHDGIVIGAGRAPLPDHSFRIPFPISILFSAYLPTSFIFPGINFVLTRVGRYFDILINRDISNRGYPIEAKNLSDDLSSCSMNIVILLGNMYITWRILKK